jgi:cytochrome b involved in lipid metabolism
VTPTPTPTATATSFTLAQVASHSTLADCWTAIGGKVYNLSGWAASGHPGGSGVILSSVCGKDATTAFNGQHSGKPNPASILASHLIGTLV